MADIFNRLLLETKDFDAKLSNSKKGVNDYQSSVTDMAKTAGAGVLKFAGYIGAAVTASEAFTKTINSTQTTGDAWVKVQDQMKASVDSFFTSIAMGNFDGFLSNLQNVIDKAGDLSVALDNLGTKTLFNNSEVDDLNTKYQLEINAAKARNISDEERNKHLQKARGILVEMTQLQGSLAIANKETSYTELQAEMAKIGFNRNVSKDSWEYLLKDSNRSNVERHANKYTNTISNYEDRIEESKKYSALAGEMVSTSETDKLRKELDNYKKSSGGKFDEMTKKFIELADDEQSGIYKAIQKRRTANALTVTVSNKELEIANADAKINGSYNKQNGNGNGSGSKTPPPVVGSIGEIDAKLSELNKDLISATTMQARIAVQTTINELEAKKISLKIATDKGAFTAEHGNNKFDVSNTRKNFSQYTDIDKQISAKRKELIGATTEDARKAVLNTINELETKKFNIRISLEEDVKDRAIDTKSKKSISEYMDIDSRIAEQRTSLINATTDEARKAVQVTIDELKARKIKLSANIDIKPNMSSEIAGVINADTKNKEGNVTTKGAKGFDPKSIKKIKSPVSKSDIKLLVNYQEGLYGIGDAMGFLAGKTNEEAASWLNWGASVLNAVGQAIPAIEKLIPALTAKAGAEAIAQTSGAGPLGWIMAGVAVASILASFASLPKFANGGIIEGGSTFGDMNLARVNSGEMILNRGQQSRLFNVINSGEIARNTEIVNTIASTSIRGKDLILVINNELKSKGKKTL